LDKGLKTSDDDIDNHMNFIKDIDEHKGNEINSDDEEHEEEENDNDDCVYEEKVKVEDAITALNVLKKYLMQSNYEMVFEQFNNIESELINISIDNLKQSKITDFF
jgi:hypothetical protein